MARKFKGDAAQMCLTADVQDDVIAGGYEDGIVTLWDLRCKDDSYVSSGRCGNGVDPYDDVSSIAYANQQTNKIYVSAGKCIYHLDTRNIPKESWTTPLFQFNEDDINQISISEKDEMIAAADDNNVITVVDLKNSRLLTTLKKHKNVVYTVRFRPGKPRELISGGFDCLLVHWDVLKSRVMGSFNLSDLADPNWELPKAFNPSYVLSCDFGNFNGPDTKPNVVMAGTENGNLHRFHCEKNLLHYQTFKAHDLGVTNVHFVTSLQGEPSVNYFACSGSNDGKIKIWDCGKLFTEPSTPEALRVIEHGSKINFLCSIQQKHLVVCDTSGDIILLPLNGE